MRQGEKWNSRDFFWDVFCGTGEKEVVKMNTWFWGGYKYDKEN